MADRKELVNYICGSGERVRVITGRSTRNAVWNDIWKYEKKTTFQRTGTDVYEGQELYESFSNDDLPEEAIPEVRERLEVLASQEADAEEICQEIRLISTAFRDLEHCRIDDSNTFAEDRE